MRTVWAVVLLALTLFTTAACAGRIEPIYNVKDHPIPAAAQKLSVQDIGRNIMIAGAGRRWQFEQTAPDKLQAKYDNGKHAAVIDIAYSKTAYSITLVSTVNLHQKGDEVHRQYNFWIRNLEKDIDSRLSIAGIDAK